MTRFLHPLIAFLSRLVRPAFAFVIAASGLQALAADGFSPGTRQPFAPLPQPPILDEMKADLGSKLFADPILSSKAMLACTSCHDLQAGGTINMPRTIGYCGRQHRFNAPTIFNVGNNYRFGWQGGFTSLEEQNESVLLDKNIMNADWPTLIERLRNSDVYRSLFEQAYHRNPDRSATLDALATYQRSLTTPNSDFDRYLMGDPSALSADATAGMQLFRNYGCASCHQGSNLGGNMFQSFGIYTEPPPGNSADGDVGRFALTGNADDKGVFRVPSLRNVAVTAPYFHDGRAKTLEEAVDVMGKVQLGRPLSQTEIRSLVAFLKAFTGEYHGKKLQTADAQKHD
ncbi:cytochrome-c peroxidase [Rhizobium mayense]|uniref:Cytochrome c peroxidase n=1 Tax=Rhizobium mayense TaxID=1312184 RepID=A0ABT7K4S4_9HYPH|nr:cytochrome c peroxidase [Rhizobium mayense]MDL2403511.1 cytochrome c peroxidase [Rhizobium mayense]